MNETMAPTEPSNEFKRRHNRTKQLSRRKRDNGFGGGFGDKSKTGNGAGIGGGNGNPSNNNNGINEGDNGRGGRGNDKAPEAPFSSLLPVVSSIFQVPTSSSITQTSSTAVTNLPTTVVTSTSAATESQRISTAPVSSSTSISSPSPVTTSSTTPVSMTRLAQFCGLANTEQTLQSTISPSVATAASITAYTSLPDTSTQSRDGVNTDGAYPSAAPTRTQNEYSSTAATAFAKTAPPSATTSSFGFHSRPNDHHGGKHEGLSPTLGHVLIAFGAIGAFVIFLALVFFISRMKKVDLLSKARGQHFSKGGARGWYGWREKGIDYTADGSPPKYTGYDEFSFEISEQKPVPAQRQLEAFFSPTTMPRLATPESAAALSRPDIQRQENVCESPLDDANPFGVLPPQIQEQSATLIPPNQNPSYDSNAAYNPYPTYDSNKAVGGLSRQTSDAYDPAQKEERHMSYLSSLSSGFGDQIIIPEAGPSKPNDDRASRQSYRQSRKFPWATSARNRDTVYTIASIDSTPPRFRTINSWVAQQTGRVQRQQEVHEEVPNMPEIPKPLQIGFASNPAHQRTQSDISAFKQHPGDEIEFPRGSRIPSTILDKKLGVD